MQRTNEALNLLLIIIEHNTMRNNIFNKIELKAFLNIFMYIYFTYMHVCNCLYMCVCILVVNNNTNYK